MSKKKALSVGVLKQMLNKFPDDLPVLLWTEVNCDDFYTNNISVDLITDVVNYDLKKNLFYRLHNGEASEEELANQQQAVSISSNYGW